MKKPPATYPEKINCILYWCEVMCHLCGERIMPGDFQADHHPFAKWQGAGNRPEEMKPSHAECNRRKGAKREARDARKTKRLEKAREALERGDAPKPENKIQGRGLRNSRFKRKFDGTVVERT